MVSLKSSLGADNELFTYSRRRIREAIGALLDAAAADGSIRADVDAESLLTGDARHLHGRATRPIDADRIRPTDRPAGGRAALPRHRTGRLSAIGRPTTSGPRTRLPRDHDATAAIRQAMIANRNASCSPDRNGAEISDGK